jgi:hypothetical protein
MIRRPPSVIRKSSHLRENDVTQRKTGPKAASAASKVLRDGRTGKASKTSAGSALSQAAPRRKGRR